MKNSALSFGTARDAELSDSFMKTDFYPNMDIDQVQVELETAMLDLDSKIAGVALDQMMYERDAYGAQGAKAITEADVSFLIEEDEKSSEEGKGRIRKMFEAIMNFFKNLGRTILEKLVSAWNKLKGMTTNYTKLAAKLKNTDFSKASGKGVTTYPKSIADIMNSSLQVGSEVAKLARSTEELTSEEMVKAALGTSDFNEGFRDKVTGPKKEIALGAGPAKTFLKDLADAERVVGELGKYTKSIQSIGAEGVKAAKEGMSKADSGDEAAVKAAKIKANNAQNATRLEVRIANATMAAIREALGAKGTYVKRAASSVKGGGSDAKAESTDVAELSEDQQLAAIQNWFQN